MTTTHILPTNINSRTLALGLTTRFHISIVKIVLEL